MQAMNELQGPASDMNEACNEAVLPFFERHDSARLICTCSSFGESHARLSSVDFVLALRSSAYRALRSINDPCESLSPGVEVTS